MVLSAYEDTIRSVRNARAVAQVLRADAEAKREKAIIDREVAITMRDTAWRAVAAKLGRGCRSERDANRQRGDLADAMFQAMKRQIAEKLRKPSS